MLIGEYTHVLDEKYRVSLPSKMRSLLGKTIVITRGIDLCLSIYSLEEWQKIIQSTAELSVGNRDSRSFVRFLLAGASEETIDASGRILIPDFLRQYAELSSGNVTIAGLGNRLEVWNSISWDQTMKSIELQGDQLAQRLSDVGML
jgi:MraZ protein